MCRAWIRESDRLAPRRRSSSMGLPASPRAPVVEEAEKEVEEEEEEEEEEGAFMAEDGYVKDPSLSRSKFIGTADMVSPLVAPEIRVG